jgi:hypothetical protein
MKKSILNEIAEYCCSYQIQTNQTTFQPVERIIIDLPADIIQDAKLLDENFQYNNTNELFHALLDEVLNNKERYTQNPK